MIINMKCSIKPLLKEMEECDSIINTMDKKLIEGLAPKE